MVGFEGFFCERKCDFLCAVGDEVGIESCNDMDRGDCDGRWANSSGQPKWPHLTVFIFDKLAVYFEGRLVVS
uniref:Uncharacterized protein n=1 Tax=Ascaris lumbricoides TaxID=6252 RepID=A0A0M3IPL0_ASCLU